jgi:hypothetical protein
MSNYCKDALLLVAKVVTALDSQDVLSVRRMAGDLENHLMACDYCATAHHLALTSEPQSLN